MKKAIASILILSFLFTMLTSCSLRDEGRKKQNDDVPVTTPAPVEQNDTSSGDGWEGLFTYDDTNTVQFTVKAVNPSEEDDYEYPWGEYDSLDISLQDEYVPEEEPDDMDEDELERGLEESLAAAEAQQEAQAQQGESGSYETPEVPSDESAESNQPLLGGRLEFSSGDTTVIIEISEYCVDADTTFTVTPIKTTALPDEFFKGGFSLSREGETQVELNDYAVITFLSKTDPGDDVVIKSFGENGELEYVQADVTKQGDMFKITGVVEHFSTVGYGSATPSPDMEIDGISQKSRELLLRKSKEFAEQQRKEFEKKSAKKKLVRTIEFDEILFTSSAADLPLQLHLRAKLVEQPPSKNPDTGVEEPSFKGKVWLKFYTWSPEGYGVMYLICNNAILPDPDRSSWLASLDKQGVSYRAQTFNMVSIGGSQAVAHGVGSANISGKTYADVQTDWRYDPASGTMEVTFTNMKGAKEKTFITGKLRARTQKQANKKLKWFLD